MSPTSSRRLSAALGPEYIVLGGGNAGGLPPNARLGDNENAFVGGFRLWDRMPRASWLGSDRSQSRLERNVRAYAVLGDLRP
jgi:hypothetical protein